MVIGNLWSVTDTAMDAITIRILHNLSLATQEMVENARAPGCSCPYKWKFEPDLLYTFDRSHISVENYIATAALVARGLPVVINGKVHKTMAAQH